jgi:hypothetical protein
MQSRSELRQTCLKIVCTFEKWQVSKQASQHASKQVRAKKLSERSFYGVAFQLQHELLCALTRCYCHRSHIGHSNVRMVMAPMLIFNHNLAGTCQDGCKGVSLSYSIIGFGVVGVIVTIADKVGHCIVLPHQSF